MLGIFLSVLSLLLYLAETGLQLNEAITSFESNFIASAVYLGYIVGSLVVVNIASAVLVLWNYDFSGKRCGRFLCVLLHSFQLGLMWRCLKLLILYDESDWREFLALRLIHTGLQTLPYIVTNGFLVFKTFSFPAADAANLFLMIFSSALSLTAFNLGKTLFEADDFSEFKHRLRKPCGICLLLLGSLFLLISRCGSIAFMLAILSYWVAIPIGAHFVIYLAVSSMYICCSDSYTAKKFLRNIIFSYLNIFDIVEPELSGVHCRNVFYYSAVLIENLVMTACWMYLAEGDYLFKLSSVVLVLVSFLLGVIFKSSSCGCIHVNTDDPISVETLDIAAYLTKSNVEEGKVSATSSRRGSKDYKTRRSRYQVDNGSSQNEDRHVYENNAFQFSASNPTIHEITGKSNRRKKLKKGRDASDGGMMDKKHSNGSNGDVASSNSRNTNTLNVSSHSNQPGKTLKSDNDALEEYNKYAISGSRSKKKRPELGVRNAEPPSSPAKSGRKATGIIGMSPGLTKRGSTRKPPIPLFPNECSNVVDSKEFGSPKAKHILSNSVKDYDFNDSDTSYSEYVSYSYYDDSTDWSTTSESGMTWPKSSTVSFVNLHSLPKEKHSNTESVQLWLSKLEAWEPLHDYNEIPVHSKSPSVQESSDKGVNPYNHNSSLDHSSREGRLPSDVYTSDDSVKQNRSLSSVVKYDRTFHSSSRNERTFNNSIEHDRTLSSTEHERTLSDTERERPLSVIGPQRTGVLTNVRGENLHVKNDGAHRQEENQNNLPDSSDNTIVLWQSEEDATHDIVQESMV